MAIMEVPADGDCMAWSLRALFMGMKYGGSSFKRPAARQEVARIRTMISSCWESVSSNPIWRTLFRHFCADKLPSNQPPVTPPKKAKKAETSAEEKPLATPERVDGKKAAEKAEKKGIRRAEGAKPVPLAQKARPADASLELPGPKRQRLHQEPEAPDLEEAYHKVMMDPEGDESTVKDVNDMDVAEVDEDMLAEGPCRKRKKHSRMAKTVCRSSTELKMKKVTDWLSMMKLDYLEFLNIHRGYVRLKKAEACGAGGWKEFKKKLLAQEMPECECCVGIMKSKGLTLEGCDAEVNNSGIETEPAMPAEIQGEDEPKDDKTGGEDAPPLAGEDEEDEFQQCLNFIKKQGPVIELVDEEDAVCLKYRCIACKTKNQPNGKVNKLPHANLKSVKFFLFQHLNGPTHKIKENAMKAREESARIPPTEIECPGFAVHDFPESNLYQYLDELRIWLGHSSDESKLQRHEYRADPKGKSLWIRHCLCPRKFTPDEDQLPHCAFCKTLADPRSVQKTVSRFMKKWHAAHLLQRRLFCSQEDLKELLADIGKTYYARNNKVSWGNVVALPNANLQAYVRRSFYHYTLLDTCPILSAFLGSIVQPCMKVNVASTKSNLAALSSQFVHALQMNQQTAPRCEMGATGGICLCYICCYNMLHMLFLFVFNIFLIFENPNESIWIHENPSCHQYFPGTGADQCEDSGVSCYRTAQPEPLCTGFDCSAAPPIGQRRTWHHDDARTMQGDNRDRVTSPTRCCVELGNLFCEQKFDSRAGPEGDEAQDQVG